MSSIFLFAQEQVGNEHTHSQLQNDLNEKLKDFSEQIKKDGVSIPDVLRPLTQHNVAQCVVGPSHMAFRLEDGRVCRVSYSVRSDRAVSKVDLKRKTGSSRSASPNAFRDGSINRTNSGQYSVRSYRSPLSMLSRTSRGINFLREIQRQGMCLTRPITSQISASEVPESLIEECQAVLEGKSRQLIIRELQHTNLDVNMAVNNLLSRDDEAEQSNIGSSDGTVGNGDDWDDESVDLLSFFECSDGHMLLDSDGMISDELIEPPTSPRHRGDLPSEYDCGFLSDRRKRRRVYSRAAEIYTSRALSGSTESSARGGLSDQVQSSTTGAESADNNKPNAGQTRHYIQLGDQLEFWRGPEDNDGELRFSAISALHSELVGLTTLGELRQWRWVDSSPFVSSDSKNLSSKRVLGFETWEGMICESNSRTSPVYYHPRIPSLGLLDERVVKLSGCSTRATVLTASGKFATWVDESLTSSLPSPVVNSNQSGLLSFEHRVTQFSELRDEVVTELHTAPLITVVKCQSDSVFWWGVYPPYMRQRIIEKSRQHRNSTSSRASSTGSKSSARQDRAFKRSVAANSSGVTLGTFVHMQSAPIFHAGAVGFTVVGGVPKVGTLLEDAWNITDVCRFRVHSSSSSPLSANHTNAPSSATEQAANVCHTTDDLTQHVLTCPHALAAASSANAATTTSGSYNTQTSAILLHNSASTSAAVSPSVASGGEQLANNASNNLTFHEMPPPPSPASSTCSDQSGPVRVSPGTFKRKKVSSSSSDRGEYDTGGRTVRGRSADREFRGTSNLISSAARRLSSVVDTPSQSTDQPNKSGMEVTTPAPVTEEDWCLRDVIFVEDGRTQPVGIVLKVDGNIAAVKFLKDQERACLAANCLYSPVCNLVNSILAGNGTTSQSSLSMSSGSSGLAALANSLGTPAMPDPMAWINDCRLLRKDDLTAARYTGSSRVPEFVQRTPKRISGIGAGRGTVPSSDGSRSKVLALAPENNRIHTVVEYCSPRSVTLAYQVYNLSGRLVINNKLPSTFGSLPGRSVAERATLTCAAEPPLLLRDGAGLVFPFVPSGRSGTGGSNSSTGGGGSGTGTGTHETLSNQMTLLDLPPVQCAAFAWTPGRMNTTTATVSVSASGGNPSGRQSKFSTDQQPQSRCLLGLVIVRDLPLMQHILRANDAQVERLLSSETELSVEPARNLAYEVVDGQRNLLHMAVAMCAPQSNCETSAEWASKLDSVLANPVQLVPLSTSSVASKDPGTRTSNATPSNNPGTAVTRPSSTFWSSIARTTAQSGPLSMHELFIRSSIEAASVAAAAAAAAASATSVQSRTEDRDPRPSVANGTNFWHLPPVRKDELTRRVASYRIIRLLLESPQLRPHLVQLLTARNAEHLTPFMLAIKCRAYSVARFIYETIQCLSLLPSDALGMNEANGLRSLVGPNGALDMNREFFYPVDSRPDDSPLFLLCYNDTCSFTWTGPDHIRQDIFECRTCGLMDSLCCCTECARVCHRGHDCRLKRTSPTAYCDCWEKCRCQSLVAGAQPPRHELFYRLLWDTELIRSVNSRNEHLLLFLAKCVERQLREQKQYRPSRRRMNSVSGRATGASGSAATTGTGSVVLNQAPGWDCSREGSGQGNAGGGTGGGSEEPPDHNLDPPRFARDALELALDCPIAVHSLLGLDIKSSGSASVKSSVCMDEEKLLFAQAGATQLDDFVFTLVCKCPLELVDTLVSTINRHLTVDISEEPLGSNALPKDKPISLHTQIGFLPRPATPTAEQMRIAAGRFVRSVARIYTSMTLELTADHKKKKNRHLLTQLAPLDICRHIFSRLAPVALAELPALAIGLLTPIRTGTLRPSIPFSLVTQSGDAVQGLEQFFATERSNNSRQRLLQLAEQNRITESSSLPEWHGMFSRTGEEQQPNRTGTQEAHTRNATTAQRTLSESRAHSISHSHSERTTVVSSLNVSLSVPSTTTTTPATTIGAPMLEPTTELGNFYNTPAPFASASLNDPSVLTLQMQSTIRDIDHDSSVTQNLTGTEAHGTNVITISSDDGDVQVGGNSDFALSEFRNDAMDVESSESVARSLPPTLRRPYTAVQSDGAATSDQVIGSTEPAASSDGCERSETSSGAARLRRPQLNEVYSTSEGYPKRRRTLTPAPVSPRSVYEPSTFPTSQDVNVPAPDEDDSKVSFGLLDTDDPASQASSTGATVATIGGSTVDFDQRSDITNGSIETVYNNRPDRTTANTEFTVSSLSLRPEQVEAVPDLPTPVELSGSNRDDEFGYSELLNSDVTVYQSSLDAPTAVVHPNGRQSTTDCLNQPRRVRMDDCATAAVDDASDGQVSDFDEDDDQDDADGDGGDDAEGNGDEDVDEDEDEDNETEDEDADDDDGYGDDDDGDELTEVDDDDGDDGDDDNDDDSSHHSDASSVDAGSRSTSPTWAPWSRNSVFSRLSSRASNSAPGIDDGSTVPVTSSAGGQSVSGRRITSSDTHGSTSVLTSSINTPSTAVTGSQQSSRPSLSSGRRTVPSVISLLPTSSSSNTAPTLVVSTSGGTGVNVLTPSDSTLTPVLTGAPESGCVIHTQVHLSRAFGCLMRVVADLMVELHEEVSCVGTMRRCSSVPSTIAQTPSVYEQQRLLSLYNNNSTSNPPVSSTASNNGSVHPLTLLLSSPMSSTNLTSTTSMNTRCFGPSMSDYQRSHLSQSGLNSHLATSVAHSLNFSPSTTTTTSTTLARLTSTLRTTMGARNPLFSQYELAEVVAAAGLALCPVWQWLAHALDNLEAQLRYSSAWNATFPGKHQSVVGDNVTWSSSATPDAPVGSSTALRRDWNSTTTSATSGRQSYSTSTARGGGSNRYSGGTSANTTANVRTDTEGAGILTNTVLGQRHDFLSYVFSLMRATSNDHGDCVPFIGAPMHKHLAYVLDALLYFFTAFESAWPSGVTHHLMEPIVTSSDVDRMPRLAAPSVQHSGRHANNRVESDTSSKAFNTTTLPETSGACQALTGRMAQREDAFFRRSESVLSLSGLGLDLVETALAESLPLALQPHRLHPNATRTDLFGSARFFSGDLFEQSTTGGPPPVDWPTHMNSGSSSWGDRAVSGGNRSVAFDKKYPSYIDEDPPHHALLSHLKRRQLLIGGHFLDSIGHSATLLSRWCLSLEFFGRHFSNDVGAEHRSYILELGGFSVKEARFRKHMERLRYTERRDLVLEVDRERSSLIVSTVRQLNAEYAKRQSQATNQSPGGGGLSTPSAGIGRYSVNYSPVSQHTAPGGNSLRSSVPGSSPIAVAVLLGTTTDSPLLGTLFGASPAPTASPSSLSSNTLTQNQPAILSCHRVKVTFRDEPGEGSGVARSFFTAFSEAVLSQEPLPQLTALLQPQSTPTTTSQNYSNTPFHHRHYTSLSRTYSSLSAAASRSLTNPSRPVFAAITSASSGVSNAGGTSSSSSSPTRVTLSSASNTPRSIDSTMSIPVPIYPNNHGGNRFSSRARTSAWRRAGGLSAQAVPFYPTSSSAETLRSSPPPPPPRRRSRSRSPLRISSGSLPASPTHATATPAVAELSSVEQNLNASSPGTSSTTTQAPATVASPVSSRPASPMPTDPSDQSTIADLSQQQQSVGNRLFAQVHMLTRSNRLAARITGMLLELPSMEHSVLLANDEALRNRVEEARAVLTMAEAGEHDRPSNNEQPLSPTPAPQSQQPILERLVDWRGATGPSAGAPTASTASPTSDTTTAIDPERVPLFWQPGIQGYYFPRAVPGINVTPPVSVDPVKLAFRYSIYRGIGRVIGLCLLTNETCPLHLSRPVLKYILGRVLHWHDFAFYDPTTFEGLRQLLRHTLPDQKEKLDGQVSDYNLTFSLIPALEEGGIATSGSIETGRTVPVHASHHLAPQGEDVDVNENNVYEFIKRYTEFKMVEAVREPLEQMRLGVFDILPRNALDRLTAEDLRLLLNGAGEIDTDVLASYTTFHNETGTSSTDLGKSIENSGGAASVDKVARLKRWFWNTVRSMDNKQRQDLLYFWTSSPALPASSQGFQPMPSITIRPADDYHLPSANTCISRLYLPLYSSKAILREKLLQAIETKSFGFV